MKFYLNVFNDVEAIDDEGMELPDLEAAKIAAVYGARELIAADVLAGKPIFESHRVEIADARGTVLHIVRYVDMVDIRRSQP